MTDVEENPVARALERFLVRPWALLAAGFGLVAAGFLLRAVSIDALTPLRVVLLLAGLMTAGFAVWFRLRQLWRGVSWEQHAAWLVLASAAVPFAASFGMDPEWDSLILVLNVVTAVGLFGALLVVLPSVLRRAAISVLILFHFLGIFVATTAIAVPPSPPPWWNTQLWVRVYRNYYGFMYLSNAYHFYSPNPGPATLLWFRIEYADQSYRWVEIPVRKDFATRLAFQRRLGMAEKANPTNAEANNLYYSQDRFWHRLAEGQARNIPLEVNYPAAMTQYQEPMPGGKYYLSTYARHAAVSYPSLKDPSRAVVGVKIYKATQTMLEPAGFAAGNDPLDPALYDAYFLGDFTPEGELRPNDGFLYWRLPIVWKPLVRGVTYPTAPDAPTREVGEGINRQRLVLVDYVKVHAGDVLSTPAVAPAPVPAPKSLQGITP